MVKIRRYLFGSLALVVLVCVYSLGLFDFIGLPRIIEEKSVPDFWGGYDLCGSTTPGGQCNKCCNYRLCFATYEPSCTSYTEQVKCSAAYETVNIASGAGYACDYSGKSANNCQKSNWGDCSKRYKCGWYITQCCAQNPNDSYPRQGNLDCSY